MWYELLMKNCITKKAVTSLIYFSTWLWQQIFWVNRSSLYPCLLHPYPGIKILCPKNKSPNDGKLPQKSKTFKTPKMIQMTENCMDSADVDDLQTKSIASKWTFFKISEWTNERRNESDENFSKRFGNNFRSFSEIYVFVNFLLHVVVSFCR